MLWLGQNPGQFDYEVNASHQITIEVQDTAGLSYNTAHTVNVVNVNEAPHDITVIGFLTVAENSVAGSPVGTVVGHDVDDTTLTFNLTDDAGGRFTIDAATGDVAVLDGGLLDYETNASHQIMVDVEDLAGLKYTKTFTVNITDENEKPHAIAITSPLIVNENAPVGTAVGTVVGEDSDDATFTYSLLEDAGGRFAIDGNTGTITVLDGSQLDHEISTSHQITVEVLDAAGLSHNENFNVSVVGVNEAPLLGGLELTTIEYTENDSPVFISSNLVIVEPDNEFISSAKVSISDGYALGEDELLFNNQTGITGLFDSAAGVLSLTGNATAADYEAAIKSIAYQNNSENPTLNSRLLKVEVSDGFASSNVQEREVKIIAVNDEEQIVVNAGMSVQFNGSEVLSNSMLAASDFEQSNSQIVYTHSGDLSNLELQIGGVNVTSFTQQDLDAGLVSIVSTGAAAGEESIALLVDDGFGQTTALNFAVDVVSETEPTPAAALPEPISYVEDLVITMPPATSSASPVLFESLKENTNSNIVKSEDSLNQEPSSETVVPNNTEQQQSEDESTPILGEATLESLRMPDFVNVRSSLDAAAIAQVLSDPPAQMHNPVKLNAMERVEQQLASLLSLDPLTVTQGTAFGSLSSEAALESSLEKLQKQFTNAADNMENRAFVRDSVVGFSVSLTAGFLVWMLRSGALLASMFSISP